MTEERMIIGLSGKNDFSTLLLDYALDDADDSMAMLFVVPRGGVIDSIGFFVTAVTGSPPGYIAEIDTVGASGSPSGTLYGGCAQQAVSVSSSGWSWITLDTPATAVAGDVVASVLKPSETAPSAANNIRVSYGSIGVYGYGYSRFSTSWTGLGASPIMAVRYSDGEVFGVALSSSSIGQRFASDDSPDEVGTKFVCPFDSTLYRATIYGYYPDMDGTINVVLYDGSDSVLAEQVFSDADFAKFTNGVTLQSPSGVSLSAGSTYRLTVKATNTVDNSVYRFRFESAAAKAFMPWSSSFMATERTDEGAWTDAANDMIECSIELGVDFSSLGGGTVVDGEYAYIG